MSITVSAISHPITVAASGGSVGATVPAPPQVSATVTGAAGPPGEPGPATSIGAAPDVDLVNISDGDVLRYSSSKWRNHPEASLVDGGNFG